MNKAASNKASLEAKVAAEKTAEDQELKTRVAAAWTLAKTQLPNAPHPEQVKFAQNLLTNSTRALTAALRQTAINAHWTRVAEQFAKVHKVDMNDLLEDPSIYTKEKAGVTSELKGDAKNAASKKADDRKDAGPLPAAYPEPKRTEPTELDGGKAAEGRPESWTEGPGSKEAGSKKAACGDACKGKDCEKCKKEASLKAKKAEEEKPKDAEEGEKKEAEDEEPIEEPKEEPIEEPIEEPKEEPVEGEEPVGEVEGEGEVGETFDPAKTKLEEAAEDLEHDVEQIQDAIADLQTDDGEITFGHEDEDQIDNFFADESGEEGSDSGLEGLEGTEGDLGAGEGQELNLGDIFSDENFADKVSALNGDPSVAGLEIDIETNDGDFFQPSDGADLEQQLEQEEEVDSPASMFAQDTHDDPLARIMGSLKTGSDAEIVKPGDLRRYFDSETAASDPRDAEVDHDGDIFEEVFRSLKQPTRTDSRDTRPNLKEPKAAAKKTATLRRITPVAKEARSIDNVNLASLLMGSDDNY